MAIVFGIACLNFLRYKLAAWLHLRNQFRETRSVYAGPRYGLPNTRRVPATTLFSRFCGTGGNSHTDRLKAGEGPGGAPSGLIAKFTQAHHFVIGHSHGGNAILYATVEWIESR